MRLIAEAHLPANRRSVGIVRYLPGKRRSWVGWAVFAGFILLNETRGLYVVVEVLKAWNG